MSINIKRPSTYANKVFRRLRQNLERLFPKLIFFCYPPQSEHNHLSEWNKIAIPFTYSISLRKHLNLKDCETIVSHANSICDNELHLLGSNLSCSNENIDWHTDFINNFTWPSLILYSNVRSHTVKGADIKVPWELSRFNFGIPLSLAYLVNKDKKYLNKFINLSTHWIDSNPIGYGVNWACTMDVAIRAINWTIAIAILSEPLSTDAYCDFRNKIICSLWIHANFIRTHLEWNGPKANSGANHLLFDLAGLYTLGVFFKDSTKGKKWLKYAQNNLEIQMDRQVLDDGVHFECSIGYHRLCLEAFLWCNGLAERNKQPFSSKYNLKLKKMQMFVSCYVRFSSIAPLIGDNDDGRLVNSSLLPVSNHSYLLPESNKGEFYLDRFLLDGSTSVGHHNTSSKSSSFENSGFFFFYNSYANLIVRAGILAFDGTHAHNDQLSFSLSIKGQDVFVDRGTCQYSADPQIRNLFRSTEAHNSLQINKLEQNKITTSIFTMNNETKTKIISKTKSSIQCKHQGFSDLMGIHYSHERNLAITKKSLLIKDTIQPLLLEDVLSWNFHLNPGLNAKVNDQEIVVFDKCNYICTIKPKFKVEIQITNFQHSPAFGILQNACKVHLKYFINSETPSAFFIEINWGD